MLFIPVYFIQFSVIPFFLLLLFMYIFLLFIHVPVGMYTMYFSSQIEKNRDNGLFIGFFINHIFTKTVSFQREIILKEHGNKIQPDIWIDCPIRTVRIYVNSVRLPSGPVRVLVRPDF